MTDYPGVKIALHKRQGGLCAACRKPIGLYESEIAHRIPQKKHLLKKYGKAVIHHLDNLALVCLRSDRCNSGMDIRNHPMLIDELVGEIRAKLEEGGEREE